MSIKRLYSQLIYMAVAIAILAVVIFTLFGNKIIHHFNRVQLVSHDIKIIVPEGSTVTDISEIIQKQDPGFSKAYFINLAKQYEGYLFPDTYFLPTPVDSQKVISLMMSTFNKRINELTIQDMLSKSHHTLSDVIIMASLLEGEARQTQTRRIVAGILWKRIEQKIPLQVDAAFKYVNGKTTSQLTTEDLHIDSPYNTYIHRGLPPTPISSPGLDSITAAITAIHTNYLYFLTDNQGVMHYARTLTEHIKNKKLYLHD